MSGKYLVRGILVINSLLTIDIRLAIPGALGTYWYLKRSTLYGIKYMPKCICSATLALSKLNTFVFLFKDRLVRSENPLQVFIVYVLTLEIHPVCHQNKNKGNFSNRDTYLPTEKCHKCDRDGSFNHSLLYSILMRKSLTYRL